MKNRLELIRILDEKRGYDSFSNQYKNEYLHKVHVIIDDKSWGNIVILETWRSGFGSVYCTLGDWQAKQPETIEDFYNYALGLDTIYLETDELNGTITEPIVDTVFDATDIL